MLNTLEAMLDEQGQVHFLEPIRLSGRRRVLVTILEEPPLEAPASEAPPQTTKAGRLLALLEKLEQLPRSKRTTEEMNADIQAERDAWER